MAVSVFGIRHHGPGSAKSLIKALKLLKPDCILIEGPPDAHEIINLANSAKMKPPVAILIYLPDNPKKSAVYPFASFSPEWQAIQFALKENIPVSFMDLPQYFQLGKEEKEESEEENNSENEQINEEEIQAKSDPITILAKISGFNDGEMWWENFVENRKNNLEIFSAITEMMTTLRTELELPFDPREAMREAYMRKTIRKAEKSGFKNIAVVCGAWHVPVLTSDINNKKNVSEDEKLLKDLKKVKTQATWIPWTYSRLSFYSGYGAGVESPGWYHHLWTTKKNITVNWMAKVAKLFRDKDLDVSSAHLIEATRLAETLTIIRDINLVGLQELNDATQSVLCFGNTLPLKLIQEQLIVGIELGEIPTETPMTPIQQDFLIILKKLRLKTELNKSEIDLDLRKENDLQKSYLLHRLNILNINWGRIKYNSSGKKGTFHELWDLEWKPEFSILLIEAGIWGNTILDATNAYAINRVLNYKDLAELTSLLEVALVANIPVALESIMKKLEDETALSADVEQLIMAVPPLANIMRYGNVRKTDTEMVKKVLDGLISRISIGLPNACSSINYDASSLLLEKVIKLNDSLKLLQDEEYLEQFYNAILLLSETNNINGLISGYSCRTLFDSNKISLEKTSVKMSFVLSSRGDVSLSTEWLEGFLKGSALLLIHNEKLLGLIDSWLISLSGEDFINILPILRRNFADFSNAEKRQIGEIIKNTDKPAVILPENEKEQTDFSYERAKSVLPVLKRLMGVNS